MISFTARGTASIELFAILKHLQKSCIREVLPGLSGHIWWVVFLEVEAAVRTTDDELLVRKGNVKFQEKNSLWADSSFFKVFDFKLIKGNPKTALNEPLSIVFSESAVKKYFGDKDPIGQTVLLTGDGFTAKITGVMKDIPENSMIKADMIVSMNTLTRKLNPGLDDQWGNYGNRTYVLLRPGANAAAFEKQIPAFLEKMNGTEMKQLNMYPTLILEKFPGCIPAVG